MGCDIHLHIEVKIGNVWKHYAAPCVPRNYLLFSKIANVRNYDNLTPISKPKGLPYNLSLITYLSYKGWEEDAHSMSYLNSQEIGWLSDWLRDRGEEQGGRRSFLDWDLEFGILKTHLEGNSFRSGGDWPDWVSDVRFVFWFDN